jgi:excisionase family DNA binding protein
MSNNVIPLPRREPRHPSDTPSAEHLEPAPVIPISACAVYTVAEVAHLLSLSRGSTYSLVRSGEIPALKLGGRWVIPKRRFHTWIDNLPTASTDDLDKELAKLERAERRTAHRTGRHGA